MRLDMPSGVRGCGRELNFKWEVRESLTEKVIFEVWPEGGKGLSRWC